MTKILSLIIVLIASIRSLAAQQCDNFTDDTAAIQALLDAGGTIVLPEGPCKISGLVIRIDGTQLLSRGRTVLRRIPGTYETLISLPRKWTQLQPTDTVKDVRISGIVFDGNHVGAQPGGQPNFFGVHVIHGERILIDDVVVQDQYHDGISIGVGHQAPKQVTVSSSRIYGAQRNGVHLGYGDTLRLSNLFIDDTPSQQWGPAAGNGIDVEVEGVGSYVRNFVIENCTISRFHSPSAGTAGTGIALQPAYGPIQFGTIKGNTIRNHQTGVWLDNALAPDDGVTASVDSITIDGNTIIDDHNWADGYGIALWGVSKVQITNNHINTVAGPRGTPYSILIQAGRNHLVMENRLVARTAATCHIKIQDAASGTYRFTTNVTIKKNGYNRLCSSEVSPNATGVVIIGNYRH
jgi:Right handed beta helix region